MATMNVRMDDEEYEIIKERAAKAGLSVSDYARLVCLNAEIKVSVKLPKD
jgi:predicted DNA binding CopG/RHH family protein